MRDEPQIINELSTPEATQDTSPPKNIYEELFKNWVPEDGTSILKAICAVGDEIRALRLAIQDESELWQQRIWQFSTQQKIDRAKADAEALLKRVNEA